MPVWGDRVNEVADLSRRDSPSHAAETLAVKLSLGTATSRKERHERSRQMFRTLEEHAERFHGKSASLVVRLVRFKALVIGSVLVIGALLSVVMSLE